MQTVLEERTSEMSTFPASAENKCFLDNIRDEKIAYLKLVYDEYVVY
jgi:hypothetical protein